MDKKLVGILTEAIKLPTLPLENVPDLKTEDNLVNYRVDSRNTMNIASASQNSPLLVHDKIVEADNNATIAIKLLYDSCMREGKTFYRKIQRLIIVCLNRHLSY